MKSKSLIAIAGTALVAGAAWYISHVRAPETDVGTPPLFPDLVTRVNDVKRVEIDSRSNKTVLVGDGAAWRIENRDGYPARFEDVKRTILALGELKIIEPKTKLPEMYTHIGVEDVAADGSNSMQVTLKDASGQSIAALIVGKERASTSGPIKAARYVRKAGEAQSYLVEGELTLSADALSWTDRSLLSVPAARIREVLIEHPGKDPVRISRQKAADIDLTLDGVPTGHKVRSTATVTSLASALEELRFDDVRASTSVAFPADAVVTTLKGFDGLVARVRTATVDGKTYSQLAFDFDPAAVTADAGEIAKPAEVPELPVADGEDKPEPKTEEDKPAQSVADEVKALNERVQNWVFVLPDYKQAMLSKTLDDLVAKIELAKPAEPVAPPPDPLTVEHFDEQGRPIPPPAGAPPAPGSMPVMPPGEMPANAPETPASPDASAPPAEPPPGAAAAPEAQ
jgi:hypothetical protein